MKISEDYLFRYVPKFEYLTDTLVSGFEYRMQLEEMALTGDPNNPYDFLGVIRHQLTTFAVCFCDLPLELSAEHRSQYGEYAIAMNKEWGMRNGATPVRYYHIDSPDFGTPEKKMYLSLYNWIARGGTDFSEIMRDCVSAKLGRPSAARMDKLPKSIKLVLSQMSSEYLKVLAHLLQTMHLTRVYQGPWVDRVTGKTVRRRFYDEREWRAISFIEGQRLNFEWSDVKYVIVKNEAERKRIWQIIRQRFFKDQRAGKSDREKVRTAAEMYSVEDV
jgi:hypothetical protein